MCPRAFCEDHLSDFARDHITNKCARFQACGQVHPTQACFVHCSNRCAGFSKLTAGGTDTVKLFSATIDAREEMLTAAAHAADNDSDELQRKKIARAERIRAEQLELLARATTKAEASSASKESSEGGAKRKASPSPRASSTSDNAVSVSGSASPGAKAGARARKKQRRAESRETMDSPQRRDDLTKLCALYAATLGHKARGALANNAERLAKAIVAKQAENAAAETARVQEAETKSVVAGGAAATEIAWKRMSINSATAKFAMRRRIAVLLETGVAPLPLRALPGAPARIAALSKVSVRFIDRYISCASSSQFDSLPLTSSVKSGMDYLHSLLFAAAPGSSGAAAEILAWDGIGGDNADVPDAMIVAAATVPRFHDARSHVTREIRLGVDSKARAAHLFLRLVRQMGATKSEGGLFRRVADEVSFFDVPLCHWMRILLII